MDREEKGQDSCLVEIRIHRINAGKHGDVEIAYSDFTTVPPCARIEKEIAIVTDDGSAYAVLALMQNGAGRFSDIQIRVLPLEQQSTSGKVATTELPLAGRSSFLKMRNVAAYLAPVWAKRLYRRTRDIVAN